MDYLSRIRVVLGVYEQDELLRELIDITKEKIISYLNVNEIPQSLSWILVELVVQRFNRIGSEGLVTESVDGKQNSYVKDELLQYKGYLDEYISQNATKRGYRLL
ncbi:Phage gp6-like head-tail connector protein [uncultured Clostridium sp.]|nr:Phage gp6-like head-tail connector protein [uncultured Clostridium sp.]